MRIIFKNDEFQKLMNNKILLIRKYGHSFYKQWIKILGYLQSIKDIEEVKMYPSLKLEKKKGTKLGKFRINRSWRVEFDYSQDENFLKVS